LPVVGYDGNGIPVLTMVGFADQTYVEFGYNDFGQVSRITQYASDSDPLTDLHPRNYSAYDYELSSGDCPRITAARVWAENWSDVNGVPHEIVTTYGANPGGSHYVITPDQATTYYEVYGAGWQKGLLTHS